MRSGTKAFICRQTLISMPEKRREVLNQIMDEWKAQVSFRIRQDLRREIEEFAAREKRSLGNVGAVLLEWGFEQLKASGSIDRLLKYKVRTSTGHAKQPQAAER